MATLHYQEQMVTEQAYRPRKMRIGGTLLYLFLSFPLGLIYFVLLVTGLSVGLGTIIVWVGIPILFLTLAGVRGMAALERDLARGLLHMHIPAVRQKHAANWREWFGMQVRDPLTWKSLAYPLIKFPLGILSFCLVMTLVTTSIALILGPIGYLVATYILHGMGVHLVNSAPAWVQPFSIQVTGDFDLIEFAKCFVCSGVGILVWMVSRYVLNGLGRVSGELAHIMLTSGDVEAQPHDEQYMYQYQAPGGNIQPTFADLQGDDFEQRRG